MYAGTAAIGLWETVEVTLTADRDYDNPYKDVEVWAMVEGPGGFSRKVWAFWDGGRSYKLRLVPMAAGDWRWTSASNQDDAGLAGHKGQFSSRDWTEADKQANPNRRGFIQPAQGNRSWQYADGTPFFLLADTWWGAGTWRYPLRGAEAVQPLSSDPKDFCFEAGIAQLKASGFNSIGIISALPNWNADGPDRLVDDAGVLLRKGKVIHDGTNMAMHSDGGHRAFAYPGRAKGMPQALPDYDRIDPAYFQDLDKKLFHLSEQGFVPYLESLRRDLSPAWHAYHDWPRSFSRYLNYLAARYGSLNFIYGLLHYDTHKDSISPELWLEAIEDWYSYYVDRQGMPFGQPTVLMGGLSTYREFGHITERPWLHAHSVGNYYKDHSMIELLEEAMRVEPPVPGYCNEPYYMGWPEVGNGVDGEVAPANSYRDNYFARAHAYGHVLSGGLAGHIVGTGSRWTTGPGEAHSEDFPPPTETLRYTFLAEQVHLLREFVFSEGLAYRNLEPASEHLSARRHPDFGPKKLEGWSHMVKTPDSTLALIYCEQQSLPQTVSGLVAGAHYEASWFDVRCGHWSPMGEGRLRTDDQGRLSLPPFPASDLPHGGDWAGKLKLATA